MKKYYALTKNLDIEFIGAYSGSLDYQWVLNDYYLKNKVMPVAILNDENLYRFMQQSADNLNKPFSQ